MQRDKGKKKIKENQNGILIRSDIWQNRFFLERNLDTDNILPQRYFYIREHYNKMES